MTCLVYSNPSSRSRSGLDVGCGAFRRGFTGGAVPSAAGPRRRQRAALGIWPALRVTGPREPGPPSSLPAGGASSQVAPDGLVCSPEASRDFPGRGEEGVTEEARGPLWAQDRLEVGSERSRGQRLPPAHGGEALALLLLAGRPALSPLPPPPPVAQALGSEP